MVDGNGGARAGRLEGSARGYLLTWNGSWRQSCSVLKQKLQGGVAPEVARGVALQRLCETIAQSPELISVFDGFWEHVCALAQAVGALHVSAALEVSTRSELKGRLRLHCFLSHPQGGLSLSRHAWRLRFDDWQVGHISPCRREGRGSSLALAEGHYYLQMRKNGSVLQRTNYVKCRDFVVQARWALNQWRLGKLTHEAVRLEVIESRNRVVSSLHEIAGVEAAEAAVRAKGKEDALLRGVVLSPFKEALPQEQAWLDQYRGGVAPALRYKVLVYDGPSRCGKSQRAEHWFGAAQTLTVNCQGVSQPNLRAWLAGPAYKAILFDEADWTLVWGNRKLMQAGPKAVLLGQSTCQQHAYSVHVHGIPMLLTSNGFWRGCEEEEAREWVEANIMYVDVQEPTWEPRSQEALPLSSSANAPSTGQPALEA